MVSRGLEQALADGGGHGRAGGEPGRERAGLLEQVRRGQDPVHHAPLVHLGGRVDIAGHHQLGGAGHPGPGDQALGAAAARGEANGRLDQAERRVLGGPHQVAAQAQLEPDGQVQRVHHHDRGHREPLQGLHQGQEAGHQRRALGRTETLELVHVHPGAEHLALGPEQHRARPTRLRGDRFGWNRGVPGRRPPGPALRDYLVKGVFQIGRELGVEQVERGRRDHQLGHVTGPGHVRLRHAGLLSARSGQSRRAPVEGYLRTLPVGAMPGRRLTMRLACPGARRHSC